MTQYHKKTYRVRYELDEDGWWVASVVKVKGCHTQGKSIVQARRRIREALALFVDDEIARAAELVDDVKLPTKLAKVVDCHADVARRTAHQNAKLQAVRVKTARALTKAGLSVRDAGEVLGISHQRVQQLVAAGK